MILILCLGIIELGSLVREGFKKAKERKQRDIRRLLNELQESVDPAGSIEKAALPAGIKAPIKYLLDKRSLEGLFLRYLPAVY